MKRSARWLVGAGLAIALGGLGRPALADWPVARHDPARTAYAAGSASIAKPTLYWEAYLGGTLSGSTHVGRDVDGDGIVDLLYLAGGKAIVKHADDSIVWETPPLDFSTIAGVADVDGDGVLEVVVSTGRNVYVLSGLTGKVLWKNPDGEVGNVGAVRMADLDGDGRPEVIIDDCGCCGVSPTANPPGGVYHFAPGIVATKLYAPSTRPHCGSEAVTTGDWDGDGVQDVAYGTTDTLILTTGKTGATLATSNNLSLPPAPPAPATPDVYAYNSYCTSANVDGRPGDELICFEIFYEASYGGARQLFAVTYDTSASPPAKTLYNLAPVDKVNGQLQWVGNSIADLDGDGLFEITVSWFDGTAWSTTILDAKTGATLATIPERIDGILDIDGDKLPEVITTTAAGLVARKFARTATPPLMPATTTFPSGWHVKTQYDFAGAATGGVSGVPLAIDLEGNGNTVPVFLIDAVGSTPASYTAVQVKGGTTSTLATYSIPSGISILTNQVYAKLNRAYPQLILARNDGFLVFLDDQLAPTNGGTFGSVEFPVVLPGMRVGGFLGSPIAPRLNGATDAVVVTDSRGELTDLDASKAWMSVPPVTAWSVPGASSPSASATLDSGKPGLVCVQINTLTALRADGTTIWSQGVPGGAPVTDDPLLGDVNGDGTSDVFAAYTSTGSVLNLQVFNGKTGAPLWASPYSEALQYGYEPFAVADHNGDGIPDMYVVSNTLRVLNGATGATLAQNPAFLAYYTPTILDVDGDSIPDITMSRGLYPARTFKHDLTTVDWTGPDDRPYQHGAHAGCTGASVWVQPSTQTQGMVRFIQMAGASVGTMQTLYLASGVAYPDAASAAAAGGFLGALGDVVVKQDLLGTGDHPSALVGSSDGFLYALNPCTAAVDWALDLKFAVGNPIFADPAGTGTDQILVPAADGYVHALQQQVLAAPAYVYDNAANGGMAVVGPDLDTVQTVSTLAASWAPVTGADGYQVAALTAGGTYVTQPDWVSVSGTSAAVPNLSLASGKKYFFAVRAVSKTKGSSPQTVSNGVVVEIPDGGSTVPDAGFPNDDGGGGDAGPVDDAGAGGSGGAGGQPATSPGKSGCGCQVPGGEGPFEAAAVLSLAVLAFGARRRGRR